MCHLIVYLFQHNTRLITAAHSSGHRFKVIIISGALNKYFMIEICEQIAVDKFPQMYHMNEPVLEKFIYFH